MSDVSWEEMHERNSASPCDVPWRPVLPLAVGDKFPRALFLGGTTLIGLGIAYRTPIVMEHMPKPKNMLAVMMLVLLGDMSCSYFDHSRASDQKRCITSMIPMLSSHEGVKDGFFAVTALASALKIVHTVATPDASWTSVHTLTPIVFMSAYQVTTRRHFASCKNNALVTGLAAFAFDMMAISSLLEAHSASDVRKPLAMFSLVISGLHCALYEYNSEYAPRIKVSGGDITDAADAAGSDEDTRRRRNELVVGLMFALTNAVLVFYLHENVDEFGCSVFWPSVAFILFDVTRKLESFHLDDGSLLGNGPLRATIYTFMQLLNICLTSQTLIALMLSAEAGGVLAAGVLTAPIGPLTYAGMVIRAAKAAFGAARTGPGVAVASAAVLRSAVDVIPPLVPLYVDQVNATYMITSDPVSELNLNCTASR
jgi:hypothetical protein